MTARRLQLYSCLRLLAQEDFLKHGLKVTGTAFDDIQLLILYIISYTLFQFTIHGNPCNAVLVCLLPAVINL